MTAGDGEIGSAYVSLADMKTYLFSGRDQKDQVNRHDSRITDAVTSASREINRFCGRQFNKTDTASPRTYEDSNIRVYRSPRGWRYKVLVDDFWSTEDLVVTIDDTVVTDYKLLPLDGVVDGEPGWPYNQICHDSIYQGSEVVVTAKWGWAAIPGDVKEACKISADFTYSLRGSMFGVVGLSDQGHAMRIRGDNESAMAKLKRYQRHRFRFSGGGSRG